MPAKYFKKLRKIKALRNFIPYSHKLLTHFLRHHGQSVTFYIYQSLLSLCNVLATSERKIQSALDEREILNRVRHVCLSEYLCAVCCWHSPEMKTSDFGTKSIIHSSLSSSVKNKFADFLKEIFSKFRYRKHFNIDDFSLFLYLFAFLLCHLFHTTAKK